MKRALSLLSPGLENNWPKSHCTLLPSQHTLEAFLTRLGLASSIVTMDDRKIFTRAISGEQCICFNTQVVGGEPPDDSDDILPWHCVPRA